MDINAYLDIAERIWPILLWVAGVDYTVRQNRKDLDFIFWEARGRQGMRDSSISGRIKRAVFNLKKRR